MFISKAKTVTDRVMSVKFWTPGAQRTTCLGSLKTLEFSEFRLPSSIATEMENFIYLKNCER